MKFSQLSAEHRSALAALVNSGPLTTDKLARVMQIGEAKQAATKLSALRKAGLIFSWVKQQGCNNYATWEANDIGMRLFNGRPDAALIITEGPAQAITKYAVVSNFRDNESGSKSQALLAAEHAALTTGIPHTVIGLVALVTPPEQPRAQITLL